MGTRMSPERTDHGESIAAQILERSRTEPLYHGRIIDAHINTQRKASIFQSIQELENSGQLYWQDTAVTLFGQAALNEYFSLQRQSVR